MPKDPIEPEQDSEYYMLPEEALHLLSEEWRNNFQAMAYNGRAALESVEKELLPLSRISNSFTSLVALRHAQKRLSEYKFATNMDAIMELDMFTTAFVVAYVRFHQGGSGSGFSRDILPEKLRSIRDQIIDARNKRFAHTDDHHSVSNGLGVDITRAPNRRYPMFWAARGKLSRRGLVRFVELHSSVMNTSSGTKRCAQTSGSNGSEAPIDDTADCRSPAGTEPSYSVSPA